MTSIANLGTLTAAGFNVVLVMLLVPPFGLICAAAATLLAQCVATLLTAVLGKRFDPVAWDYPRYAVAFVGSLALALWIGSREFQNSAIALTVKLAAVGGAAAVLGTLFWRRPLISEVQLCAYCVAALQQPRPCSRPTTLRWRHDDPTHRDGGRRAGRHQSSRAPLPGTAVARRRR